MQNNPHKNKKTKEIVGIVGGFGPVAHIGLEQEILKAARRLKGADTDQEFPPWFLSSLTETPNRLKHILGKGPDAMEGVVHSFKKLEDSFDSEGNRIKGAGFAVMACITAHKMLPEIRKRVNIEIVDMVAETAKYISQNIKDAKVGILATDVTIQFKLFQNACEKLKIPAFSPLNFDDKGKAQKQYVMDTIFGSFSENSTSHGGIKGYGVLPEHIEALKKVSVMMREKFGINAVIAGCTELDCALDIAEFNGIKVIKPYTVISEYIIKRLYDI